jgi:hypothetical protein
MQYPKQAHASARAAPNYCLTFWRCFPRFRPPAYCSRLRRLPRRRPWKSPPRPYRCPRHSRRVTASPGDVWMSGRSLSALPVTFKRRDSATGKVTLFALVTCFLKDPKALISALWCVGNAGPGLIPAADKCRCRWRATLTPMLPHWLRRVGGGAARIGAGSPIKDN